MITDVFPIGVPAPGNNLVILVPTLTTPTVPKVADASGATALDATDYIKADGWDMSLNQGRLDDTRLGDKTKRETYDVPEIQMERVNHIVDPQAAGTVAGNKMIAALPADSMVYAVVRLGKPRNTALAIGDLVDVYTVTTGADATFPQASGKYLRQVITSWSRVARGVAMVA